ncbi:YcnI family protein [Nocardia sp. NEAU-G5]|uniref:YcnI family protein n=1 Tax=Nocardia albiluteola TaxID=2842303 RepID=A0ABS6AQ67_9NOCA|nr:YcnI family protein [Nocardia albiluteola]MBU3060157.1 YcnI family protein [Nocardia albiluteola]
MSIVISRALIATCAVAGLTLLAAGTAAAHVEVSSPDASQGGDAVLTFRVPDESDTASTTTLSITLPNVDEARTQPVAGWTAKLDKNAQNQFTTVTWTADPGNAGIAPGQFQLFPLLVAPLPKQDKATFPAVQTYSDGKVVNWNQTPGPDGKEPETPVPTLVLAAAGSDDDSMSMPASTSAKSESKSDGTARWLGGIGLVLGALGAALGVGALARSRRSA